MFRQLKSSIVSLELEPGSKISEVEVAKTYNVSRQPVREAFMRLGALNLLEIRPQRATRVRKISHSGLRNTRFIRAAVEVEVVRVACEVATAQSLEPIYANLDAQSDAIAAGNGDALHLLDYRFHELICQAAGCLPAFKTIAENKTHTDRVCTLVLADACGMQEVFDGHSAIIDALAQRNVEKAVANTRLHLQHLDETLVIASSRHPDFFED
ncbi:GntR family transcriptional regulator [uncultured Roseobacter sp.]|uniref:GntR family transcriptional regulator n=1 Tax=uncultured Roseobacter sp. TaxID=114847 RepID=UPI002639C4F3|nr:GntR family transcriptional regulator [uncultured Roseobacter sp.]